jgi:hypothetical protein
VLSNATVPTEQPSGTYTSVREVQLRKACPLIEVRLSGRPISNSEVQL